MTESVLIKCEDGIVRPEDECVQDYNCNWHPECDCVTLVDGVYAHQDDEQVVQRADGCYAFYDDCVYVPYDDAYVDSCRGVRCDWCDEWEDINSCARVGNNDYVCRNCEESSTFSCSSCGELFHTDDAVLRSEDMYCEECAPSGILLSYGDKSVNYFRSESRCKLLYGIELEVEADDGDAAYGAERVGSCFPDGYCVFKEDSSLWDGGFEIVTRPDSMAVHKREWADFFNDNPGTYLSSWDTGRCGMHVHVSRSALTQLQLGKMLCFLNNPSNDRFVRKIAGRSGDEWARKSPKKITDVGKPDGRYVALNITGRTAEVRIFKGTLKQASFLKNLEFVEALVKWCAPANVCIRESMSCDSFASWVDRKEFPNLHGFLKEKGLIK